MRERHPLCILGVSLGALILARAALCGGPARHGTTPAEPASRIAMILTNVDRIPGTARETGFWAEEFVVPCQLFQRAGFKVVTASVKGGLPPVDPGSLDPKAIGEEMAGRMKAALGELRPVLESVPLSRLDPRDLVAVFVVGGHGVMWDLSVSPEMHRLAVAILDQGKVLSAVCHGPGAFARAKDPAGRWLVSGFQVTGFSAREEEAAGMTKVVPYCLEQALSEATGDRYTAGEPWQSHVVTGGNVITGQNPASSEATAKAVVRTLLFRRSDPTFNRY